MVGQSSPPIPKRSRPAVLPRALAFTPDMASQVVTAFLTAAGHLEIKQALKRKKTGDVPAGFPVPIESVEVAVGKADGRADNLVIQLVLTNRAVLNYSVSMAQIPRLIGALTVVLETQHNQTDQKPN